MALQPEEFFLTATSDAPEINEAFQTNMTFAIELYKADKSFLKKCKRELKSRIGQVRPKHLHAMNLFMLKLMELGLVELVLKVEDNVEELLDYWADVEAENYEAFSDYEDDDENDEMYNDSARNEAYEYWYDKYAAQLKYRMYL